jgi:sporulation protein YlmC with PRC-barrel domain
MENVHARDLSRSRGIRDTGGGERAMLRSLSDLRQVTIRATDGNLGSVRDGYFDDRNWTVRYVVVESREQPSRQVLIAPVTLQSSKSNLNSLRVRLATKEIADDIGVGGVGSRHLRALTALIGYTVQSEDGEIGHVEDVLLDDKAWAIRYLVVNAEKWCSDKSVLVSPEWLTQVALDGSNRLFSVVIAIHDGPARSASLSRRTTAR